MLKSPPYHTAFSSEHFGAREQLSWVPQTVKEVPFNPESVSSAQARSQTISLCKLLPPEETKSVAVPRALFHVVLGWQQLPLLLCRLPHPPLSPQGLMGCQGDKAMRKKLRLWRTCHQLDCSKVNLSATTSLCGTLQMFEAFSIKSFQHECLARGRS